MEKVQFQTIILEVRRKLRKEIVGVQSSAVADNDALLLCPGHRHVHSALVLKKADVAVFVRPHCRNDYYFFFPSLEAVH